MKLLFFLLFTIFSPVSSAEQWIDPHDMNTNTKRNLKKLYNSKNLDINIEEPSKESNSEVNKITVEENNSLIYLKRFVNLLINSADVDKSDPNAYHGKLGFLINNENFKFLTEFSNSEHVDLDQLRKLDRILSDMLHTKNYLDDVSDVFLSSQEKMVQFLFSKNSLPLLGLSLLVYIAYNLFRSDFSVGYVVRYFIVVVLLIDYVQRYQQLYEEVESHNMKVEYSTKCDTNRMSWVEYFKFMTGHQDCEKKVVSLMEVGLYQLKSVIIIPLSAVGIGMGQFGAGLWNNLPFPWNILIFPLMLIFCAILAIIIMSAVNGLPFKFNLMHLLHLEFGGKKSDITNTTLDKLLDAVNHRPFLEAVKGKHNEKSPSKRKNPPKQAEQNKKLPPEIKKSLKEPKNVSKINSEKLAMVASDSKSNETTNIETQSGNPI